MPTSKTDTETPQLELADPITLDASVDHAMERVNVEGRFRLQEQQVDAQREALREAARREVTPNPMLFHTLLAEAQAHFQPVVKNREVRVWSQRLQSEYRFKYAELPTILAACLPALNERGFFFRQYIDPTDKARLITQLLHAHGSLECFTPIILAGNDGQAYNSALTYARRSGANLMLGVAGEDDEDGNIASGNQIAGVEGNTGKGKAPKPTSGQGRAASPPASRPSAPAPQPKPVSDTALVEGATIDPPKDERAMEKAEGLIVDATAELQEAASEGRAHGITQIWDEIRSDHYVAQRVWRKLQDDTPDLFKVVKSTIDAGDKQRGGQAPAKRGDRG